MIKLGVSEWIALGSLLLALVTVLLNGRKNARTDAAAQARQEAKLDGVSRGVDDIRLDMRSLKQDLSAHAAKLAELESSAKSAHHRIDEIFALYRKAHPPDGRKDG